MKPKNPRYAKFRLRVMRAMARKVHMPFYRDCIQGEYTYAQYCCESSASELRVRFNDALRQRGGRQHQDVDLRVAVIRHLYYLRRASSQDSVAGKKDS